MKVLLITDNHSPTGGAERYFFDLKSRLKKLPGFQVYSLGFAPRAAYGEDYCVLPSLRTNLAKLIWRILPHPVMYYRLRKHLKQIKPDVIHLHNVKQYSAALLKAVKPYPIVQTMHDFSGICPTAQNIHQDHQPCRTGIRSSCFWQHRTKYNHLAYFVLALSFYLLNYRLKKTVRTFIAPSPLLTDYLTLNEFNAVYVPPFREETSPPVTENDSCHFLFAGQLGSHKGIYLLLDEFALAYQKNPALKLTIAGAGPEEAAMHAKVQALGMAESVFFVGWQPDLKYYYQQCAALLFPSIGMESFGLVLTEAMSYACPIIAINRGTAAWLVKDQETGLLFDPCKKGDMAEKLLLLAENRHLAKELGKQGQARLTMLFDNKATLTQIINIYRQVTTPQQKRVP